MKMFLKAATAAVALIGFAGTASAGTGTSTTYSHGAILHGIGVGAAYTQSYLVGDNTEAATPTVTNTFKLTGAVSKDCSYYGGGTTNHTIALGTLGVETGNNTNVSNLFDLQGIFGQSGLANINSSTAGCNFNNTVTITKANGIEGLKNNAPGGYDSSQFTDHIPYGINANWTGTQVTSGPGNPGNQHLTVGSNEASDVWTGGAWRSAFNMLINLETPSKAPVAGNYEDTITVTLAAS